ncbi:MAG: ATP-binding protein [Propionibacteriaceae bacterium]
MPTPSGKVPEAMSSAQSPARYRPPLSRDSEDAWLGGVASGIARHLEWPVTAVRLAFVALMSGQGLGLILYGALWLLIPKETIATIAPGLEAANRTGMRDQTVSRSKSYSFGSLAAALAVGIGGSAMLSSISNGFNLDIFIPVACATTGLSLTWRQADETFRGDLARLSWRQRLTGDGIKGLLRMGLGILLMLAALGFVADSTAGASSVLHNLILIGLLLSGVGLIAAPWIRRFRIQLNSAREEKLLADARADMAAHLHDSVLQTLALIQRQSDDPRAVAGLARRQERELRAWLYGEEISESTLKAALVKAAAEIEDERGVPVEVVVVGDCDLNSDGQALVRSAREAMMNAAKHSGADVIDVYAEVFDGEISVFIRDRGIGFDPAAIDDDRMGVRGSIIDRMKRHGGRAEIKSAPGEGTEVRLELQQ